MIYWVLSTKQNNTEIVKDGVQCDDTIVYHVTLKISRDRE